MSYFLLTPSSTIGNPDTNYGTSGAWTDAAKAIDGDSGTFCGKNIGGAGPDQDPAIRYSSDSDSVSRVIIGAQIEWELTESGAIPFWDVRLKWQVVAGQTRHDEQILVNTTRAKATTRYFLPSHLKQADFLTILTIAVNGPEAGFITCKIYEIKFIAVSRFDVAVMEG